MKNRYEKPELAITRFENTDNVNVNVLSSVGYNESADYTATMKRVSFNNIKGRFNS